MTEGRRRPCPDDRPVAGRVSGVLPGLQADAVVKDAAVPAMGGVPDRDQLPCGLPKTWCCGWEDSPFRSTAAQKTTLSSKFEGGFLDFVETGGRSVRVNGARTCLRIAAGNRADRFLVEEGGLGDLSPAWRCACSSNWLEGLRRIGLVTRVDDTRNRPRRCRRSATVPCTMASDRSTRPCRRSRVCMMRPPVSLALSPIRAKVGPKPSLASAHGERPWPRSRRTSTLGLGDPGSARRHTTSSVCLGPLAHRIAPCAPIGSACPRSARVDPLDPRLFDL